jgi:hypothetical protein
MKTFAFASPPFSVAPWLRERQSSLPHCDSTGRGDGGQAGRDEIDFIDRIDRPAGSTLSTLSNPQVNLVYPVNLVQNRPAGSTSSKSGARHFTDLSDLSDLTDHKKPGPVLLGGHRWASVGIGGHRWLSTMISPYG